MTERQEALLEWMRKHPAHENLTAQQIGLCGVYDHCGFDGPTKAACALADLRELKRTGHVGRSAGYPAFWHLTVRTPA